LGAELGLEALGCTTGSAVTLKITMLYERGRLNLSITFCSWNVIAYMLTVAKVFKVRPAKVPWPCVEIRKLTMK